MKIAENPKKIINIVAPNAKYFQEIYIPLIEQHFATTIQKGNGLFSQVHEIRNNNIFGELTFYRMLESM